MSDRAVLRAPGLFYPQNKSTMRIVVYHSAQVQRRSDYHYRDLVLGVYSKVGYAGTFPEPIDANNYLVIKLCCRHLRLRPNPYT